MGPDKNVGYQFGGRFVTLWTFTHAKIPKIYHMVYVLVGMYVPVNVCSYKVF